MKRTLLLLIAVFATGYIYSQDVKPEFKPSGKTFGNVFWNYHYNLSEGSTQRNTFEIQRSYLGYSYAFSEKISTKITLDVGNDDGSAFTAYLKTAQLDWNVAAPVKLSLGLIGLKQFDTQEKFWGYRYIFKSLQDEFALGTSADLGVNAEITLAKSLKANVFLLNGEGYKKIQDEMGRLKTGANLIFTPVEGLILKGYYDIYGGKFQVNDSVIHDTTSIQTIAFFAGYQTKKFRIGAEYNVQLDGKKYYEQAADHNLYGMAIYGTYVINEKIEVFVDWLNFRSNKLDGATNTWNYRKDGSVILGGVQYSPVKGVKMSLNYRTFLYDNPDNTTGSLLYLNFEYAF